MTTSNRPIRARPALPRDPISQWVSGYVTAHPSASLREVLIASLYRRYSASPAEVFFTGGGVQVFANFDSVFDDSVLTVRDGFSQSVNLVFVRLMRDVVRYYENRLPGVEDDTVTTAARLLYLNRFAERQSVLDLERF
jgi:hypothetical protein